MSCISILLQKVSAPRSSWWVEWFDNAFWRSNNFFPNQLNFGCPGAVNRWRNRLPLSQEVIINGELAFAVFGQCLRHTPRPTDFRNAIMVDSAAAKLLRSTPQAIENMNQRWLESCIYSKRGYSNQHEFFLRSRMGEVVKSLLRAKNLLYLHHLRRFWRLSRNHCPCRATSKLEMSRAPSFRRLNSWDAIQTKSVVPVMGNYDAAA